MAATEATGILGKIVASKRREIEQSRASVPERELERQLADAVPVRDFHAALAAGPGVLRACPGA